MSSVWISTTFCSEGEVLTPQKLSQVSNSEYISGIELGSNHAHSNSYGNLISILQEHTCLASHNHFPPSDDDLIINIASQETHRKKSVEFVKNALAFCVENNIQQYTLHPGFLGLASKQKKIDELNYDFSVKDMLPLFVAERNLMMSLEEIVEFSISQAPSVELLLETQGSLTTSTPQLFQNLGDVVQILERFPSINVNFNAAHTFLGLNKNIDAFENYFKTIKDRISLIELSSISGNKDAHLPILSKQDYITSTIENADNDLPIILEYRFVEVETLLASAHYVSNLRNLR